jgi:alpha-1,3-mannosyltransferase
MENFVEQLATHQLALDHQVTVATLDRIFDDPKERRLASRQSLNGVQVVRTPYRGSRRYPIAPRVLSAIRQADMVHVHGVDFFCDYLAASAWLHRRPLVLTTHGGFFHTPFAARLKTLYFNTVTRVSLSQYGAVIACSEEDERRFRPICGERLCLVPNPVDVDKFARLASRQGSTLIYFGRIAPNKEVEELIAWFAGLARTSNWKLIVAGKPMGVDLAALRSQAEQLGIAERVEIYDTPSDDDLKRLIGRSTAYACASSYEGFGLAAVEAASAGLFPVLSKIPPFRRTLERLGFGMLVDFRQPSTWDTTYAQLEQEVRQFHARQSDGAVRDAVVPFAWPAAISQFENIYNRVLGRTTRRIGPVQVDVRQPAEATRAILDAAQARRPLLVAFCNAHTVNLARKDESLRDALANALVLNDGVGLDLASKALFSEAFPGNLNGTDFVPGLVRESGTPLRLFLLGAAPGIAAAAGHAFERLSSSVFVVGTRDGFFAAEEEAGILEAIRQSGANLVLVAMGQPRQEEWALRHFRKIEAPVLCVGALFDFMAQRVPRAPALLRQARLEWLFRLAQEPSRLWRRYLLGNISFLAGVVSQRLGGTRV